MTSVCSWKRVRVLNELLGDAGFHQERMARAQGF